MGIYTLRAQGRDSQGHAVTVDRTINVGVTVQPGGNIQAAMNTNALVNLAPGIHRITATLNPVIQGSSLFLAEGADLRGSRVVTNFVSDGTGRWSASGWLPTAYSGEGTCTIIAGSEANPCKHRESVYMNNVQLKRRMTLADLQSGEYHVDYTANKIYVKDNPAQNVFEILRTSHAINSSVNDFKLYGDMGIIQHFATPAQQGAVTALGDRWEVYGIQFQHNHGSGFHFNTSHQTWLHDCRFIENEQIGITHYASDNTLIENNWIVANNWREAFWVLDWESAGIKVSSSSGAVIRNNDFVGNHGISIWLDIDWENILVSGNRVTTSYSCGIRAEIGFGATIEGNEINSSGEAHGRLLNRNNVIDTGPFATAGIMVNCSQNVIVRDNKVQGSLNPIELVQRNRTPQYSTKPGWETRQRAIRNCTVEDNEVWLQAGGITGVGQLDSAWTTIDPYYGKAWGNIAARNKYHTVSLTTAHFHMYETARNQLRDFNKWKSLMEPTAIGVVG